jgi:hypothetical protein
VPTLTVTIPSTGRVPAVLLDVAAREGFAVGATHPTVADALQAWLRGRVRGIYREQASAAAREQALTDAEAAIETAATRSPRQRSRDARRREPREPEHRG